MLTVDECAALLRVHARTVRRYCITGELRAVRAVAGRGSSRLIISRASVISWLAAHELHTLPTQ